MKKTVFMTVLLAFAASFAFAQDWKAAKSDDTMLPGVDVLKVKGNIVSAGSSTVFPLSEAIAERFKEDGYKDNITIDSIGSGAGFERFTVAGETDISNASTRINATQIANAAKIGRVPIEFRVGTDALAVCVSKSNTFAKDLTQAELAKAFSTAKLWSDIRPEFPKQAIRRFIPGTDSGTFDYFVEHVFKKKREPILTASNTQLSEDDNILVKGVAGSPYAIGFFGFAYYVENASKITPLAIDSVAPTQETVDAGKYPLARPLFIYSDAKVMKSKPQVAAFIAYYLTYVNEVIKRVGYFPAPAADLEKSKKAWLEAMK